MRSLDLKALASMSSVFSNAFAVGMDGALEEKDSDDDCAVLPPQHASVRMDVSTLPASSPSTSTGTRSISHLSRIFSI